MSGVCLENKPLCQTFGESIKQHMLPIIYSIPAAEQLGELIQKAYPIGEVKHCKLLCRGLNDSFLVETTDSRYIARIYRHGWRSQSDIKYELDVLAHLSAKGIPVSCPKADRHGELLIALNMPEGERHVVLFTYADGQPINADDPEIAREYGRNVARVHCASDDFQSDHQRFALDLDHLIDQPLKDSQSLFVHRKDDFAYLLQLSEKLKQMTHSHISNGLEHGFCHGDFHDFNAHRNEQGVITMFDFDCCGPGWRAYDISVFRWHARLNDKEDLRWEPFISGYLEERPIAAEDIKASAVFMAIRHFWLIGMHSVGANVWGCGWLNDGYLDRALTYFRNWEKQYLNV